MTFIQHHPRGVLFKIFVQPRSSKNQISGLYGDSLKIKLTAPPVAGAANTMCVKFLAKCLDVPRSSLEIISGHTRRTKQVLFRSKTDDSENDFNTLKDRIDLLIQRK